MLSQEGFDQWAPDYDKSVSEIEKEESYPFAGYQKVLATIYQKIRSGRGTTVLDLGFGTAVLPSRLYKDGYKIFGIDFSEEMLRLAQKKMPKATLVHGDFTSELPAELQSQAYDFITGTYSFHHVPPTQRGDFFVHLAKHLKKDGKIMIGDIAFPTAKDYRACHEKFKNIWDKVEIYYTADEFIRQMRELGLACSFERISICAGILTIERG
ncbi:MAG: class I SAM-dependent methyltransferase [Oscillospiraceae bacterium]|jgi:putative AdoMet-dependent methyltransferase|nr:class I SAM-dependent methyltransferase [Oscillospiraceae bacterium]